MSSEFDLIKSETIVEKERFNCHCEYNKYNSDNALDVLDQFEKFISSKKFSSDSIRKVNTLFEEVLNPMPAFNDLSLANGQSSLKIYQKKKKLTFYLSKDKSGSLEQRTDLMSCIELINSNVSNEDKEELIDQLFEKFGKKDILFLPLSFIKMSKVSKSLIKTNFIEISDNSFTIEFIVEFKMDEIS